MTADQLSGDWQGPIEKSPGLTSAEQYLRKLADPTFLSLWGYPNLFRKPGKELCDFLVIFGNHVIIFSDKHCVYTGNGGTQIAWGRWFRNAVEGAARQLWGAERSIKSNPSSLFLDVHATKHFPLALPDMAQAKFHLVAATHGIVPASKYTFGGSGSLMLLNEIRGLSKHSTPYTVGDLDPDRTFVNVFDDVALEAVLKLADTVSDFTDYLEKRERFVRSPIKLASAGEEELLAFYMKHVREDREHDFIVEAGQTELALLEGGWERFHNSPERRAMIEANKISYVWDKLIETFGRHALAGTLGHTYPPSIQTVEKILRLLASQNRLQRRVLSSAFISQLKRTPANKPAFRVVGARKGSGLYFAFVLMPLDEDRPFEEYRQMRTAVLHQYCKAVKLRVPDALDVVGIATESGRLERSEASEDACYLDCRNWTPQLAKEAEEALNGLGLSEKLPPLNWGHTEEYPIKRFQTDARGNRPSKNAQCPCGSGTRFKNCHGRKDKGPS